MPLAASVAIAHRTMGSYGGALMQCCWCNRWGKCSRDEFIIDGTVIKSLWDVDGTGLNCYTYYNASTPPHARYLQALLKVTRLSSECIAAYTYPVYADATRIAMYPSAVVPDG